MNLDFEIERLSSLIEDTRKFLNNGTRDFHSSVFIKELENDVIVNERKLLELKTKKLLVE